MPPGDVSGGLDITSFVDIQTPAGAILPGIFFGRHGHLACAIFFRSACVRAGEFVPFTPRDGVLPIP